MNCIEYSIKNLKNKFNLYHIFPYSKSTNFLLKIFPFDDFIPCEIFHLFKGNPRV